MSFFTREEYLKILVATPTAREALSTLVHDINNRTTCSIMNLEVAAHYFDELGKDEILEMLSESQSCIRDISNLMAAVNDYLQSTNNQSPTTKKP